MKKKLTILLILTGAVACQASPLIPAVAVAKKDISPALENVPDMALKDSNFKDVPPEIIREILKRCEYSDLAHAAQVCKKFRTNANNDCMRREVIKGMSTQEVDRYLVLTAAKGQEKAVKELLPPACEEAVNDALYNAAYCCGYDNCGHEKIVRMLLGDSRVTQEAVNEALYNAAYCCGYDNCGHKKIVRMLLGDSRVTQEAVNNALSNAANEKIVALLLNDSRVTQDGVDDALYKAVSNGHEAIMKELLPYASRYAVNDALRKVASLGREKIVRMLLNDLRVTQDGVNYALYDAAHFDCEKVVGILLGNSRVTQEAVNYALYDATCYGCEKIVRMLLGDSRVTQDGVNNALCTAASLGREKIVRMLLGDSRVTQDGVNGALCKAANEKIVAMFLNDSRVTQAAVNYTLSKAACDGKIKLSIHLLSRASKHGIIQLPRAAFNSVAQMLDRHRNDLGVAIAFGGCLIGAYLFSKYIKS